MQQAVARHTIWAEFGLGKHCIKQSPFLDNQKVKFTFKNQCAAELHFTVIVLSPGYHVKQIYPRWDSPKTVQGSETDSFQFRMKIPDVLKRGRTANLNQWHRDILRTVVTSSKLLSLKSLELPDIWDTNHIEHKGRSHLGRDAKLLSDTSNVDWWIKDIEIHTALPTTPTSDD